MTLDKQTIGMHGVYRVATELTGRGYVVSLTSRNAPGVDLHASKQDFTKAFSVEVKTFRTGLFLLNQRATKLNSASYIYVLLTYAVEGNEVVNFRYHIIPSAEMTKLAQRAWNGGSFVTLSKIRPNEGQWHWFE